ncbi:hypothetical protein BCCGELA001_30940 [Bradyrhizobium sp. CCGE-LA001]|nr:hypothetical protein BCCGELA001_30940 [Bradyrhizobium sp. CCGE-LA001]
MDRRTVGKMAFLVISTSRAAAQTLEYDLVVADGKVTPRADDAAHEGGSSYTADSLVAPIIDRPVGFLMKEKLVEFHSQAERLGTDSRPIKSRIALLTSTNPARSMLNLKVCDPAEVRPFF